MGKTTFLDRVLDGSAKALGKGVEGTGYAVGRIAPAVQRAAKAIADTKVGEFMTSHFSEGYHRGVEDAIKRSAEKIARKALVEAEKQGVEDRKARQRAEKQVDRFLRSIDKAGADALDFVGALLDRLGGQGEEEAPAVAN